MFVKSLTVRFSECDGLGHVNNGMYFTYMEDARVDIFRIFNPSLDLARWNLIVASARCDFLRQVKFAETLTVYTWIGRIGRTSFTVEHALQNADGAWVARGQAAMLAFDYEAGQPKPLWPEVRAELERHQEGPPGAPELRA
ncbi:acyl-CoA thioesterase [Alicyclobacillus macrosporangiidus]|uniref:acyl-CoA thioesterase n=1 Tax=Alicyclobacillus macrosporangiidus TaxID=392015 RepID=UPI0004984973|nr:thioesterase family protein [Alicyclobacillus macrosporangiidus]